MITKTMAAGAALALALAGGAAQAGQTFSYTGGTTTWTVTQTGIYDITAWGAQGGEGPYAAGGNGAKIGGDITLTAGDTLTILVGGAGAANSSGGGGGGGSFVVVTGTNTPLVIAGGGGGGGYSVGGPGLSGTDGGGTDLSTGACGGSGGNGGDAGCSFINGGGGGLLTDGFSAVGAGSSFLHGGAGGAPSASLSGGGAGGFGGGGAGEIRFDSATGGGGGGYSGGSGGRSGGGGGGGGSFLADGATNAVLVSGENAGNGMVEIDFASAIPPIGGVPEPATWAMLILGITLTGSALRRRSQGVTAAA